MLLVIAALQPSGIRSRQDWEFCQDFTPAACNIKTNTSIDANTDTNADINTNTTTPRGKILTEQNEKSIW